MFSVLLTVSDTLQYFKQSIESITEQTIGFEEDIQIIFIDYEHNNESSSIVREYSEKYPENIMVLTKDYLSQTYANNNVYKLLTGEIITIMEGNDYFSRNTFKNVRNFFNKHDNQVNIASIALSNENKVNKEHELNYKYDESRVINLEKEANNPQVNLKSCFIKKSALHNYDYDKKTLFEEETILINQLLLDFPRLGVVSNSTYHMQEQFDIKSFKDKTIKDKKTLKLLNIYKTLIQITKVKFNEIPPFILYTMAYDLQNILKINDLTFLSEEEKKRLWEDLFNLISYLDDENIYENHNIDQVVRSFFIYLKKERYTIEENDNLLVMKADDYEIDNLNKHKIWIDIIEIKDGKLNISGILLSNFSIESLKINLIKEDVNNNKEIIPCKYVHYPQGERENLKFLDIPWRFDFNFDVSLELKDIQHIKTSFEVIFEENGIKTILYPKIEFRITSGMSSLSIYAIKDNFIIFKDSSSISVIPYNSRKMFNFEIKNILKILSSSKKGKFNATLMHLVYLVSYPFMNKKRIWLINDRLDSADDNAKHLFKYACSQNDGITKYFIIDKHSKDLNELKRINKNVITYGSFKHKILYLFCEKRISSFLNEMFYNPFYNEQKDDRQFFCNLVTAPKYFLQHGVISCDLTKHIKRFNHNLSLIVTSSDSERQSFFDLEYNYPKHTVQALGLPRYDTLTRKERQKKILFIPSWRSYLDKDESLLLVSDYYKSIESLLNNEDLRNLLNKTGYELIFKPHPELVKYAEEFNVNDNIKISVEDSFQKLFNTSSLLISDFSSVIFDFSYLKKPVIYYQPNDDYHYDPGYFSYDKMGFGDVIKDENSLIKKIEYYINNNCSMEEKYQERVTTFFKYNDHNNSKRVYDWIKENS